MSTVNFLKKGGTFYRWLRRRRGPRRPRQVLASQTPVNAVNVTRGGRRARRPSGGARDTGDLGPQDEQSSPSTEPSCFLEGGGRRVGSGTPAGPGRRYAPASVASGARVQPSAWRARRDRRRPRAAPKGALKQEVSRKKSVSFSCTVHLPSADSLTHSEGHP